MIRITYHFTNGDIKTINYRNDEKLSKLDLVNLYLVQPAFFGDENEKIFIDPKQVCWFEIEEV